MDHANPINPISRGSQAAQPGQDACASIEAIRENIEYDWYMQDSGWRDREMFGELYGVICSTVRAKRSTVRVGRADLPYGLVAGRLLELKGAHLEYVIECMRRTTSKIRNIRAYMLTALYNALDTMGHYYQQEAQHDLYGGGMPMPWGDAPIMGRRDGHKAEIWAGMQK